MGSVIGTTIKSGSGIEKQINSTGRAKEILALLL
jgi:hypothetical protein